MGLLAQLKGLLLQAVPTIILVILFYFFLRSQFFGPLLHAMDERDLRTEGARREAEESTAAAQKAREEYEAALRKARRRSVRHGSRLERSSAHGKRRWTAKSWRFASNLNAKSPRSVGKLPA